MTQRRTAQQIYTAAEEKIERARERRVVNLHVGERRRSLRKMPALAGLSFLRSLSLPETGVSDLSFLSDVPLLTSLNLSNTPVWDISPLAKLKNLVHLDLSYTNVTDISAIAELKKLKTLVLRESACVNLGPLAFATSLSTLDLGATRVEDISPLSDLVDLTGINLTSTRVRQLEALANLNKLHWLVLDSSKVTDLGPLATLKSLVIHERIGTYYYIGGHIYDAGLSFSDCPLEDKELLRLSKLADGFERTKETISYLRRLQGLPPLTETVLNADDQIKVDGFDQLRPVENISSPFAFQLSAAGNIVLTGSAANIPVFPSAASAGQHANRLDVCRTLAKDIVSDLGSKKFQVRSEYGEILQRYESRLPIGPDGGNILLADAEARTLRNLFAAEADFLSVAFASKLKTFLEQHIGLRVFYPEIMHFYRDVQSGRLELPLSLDAVDAFVKGVKANTPVVFDPAVAGAIEGSAEPASVFVEQTSSVHTGNEQIQPLPPRDPLGEIDPQKSRDFTFAGAANGLWKAFLPGERVYKAVDGWKTTGETLYPHVTQIIDWLRQFVSSGDGTPPMPPTLGV